MYMFGLKFVHSLAFIFAYYVCLVGVGISLNGQSTKTDFVLVSFVFVLISTGCLSFSLKRLKREIYICNDTFQTIKKESDTRLSVVIPPVVASYVARNQSPICYDCKDVGLACIVISNMNRLMKERSYNDVTYILHLYHSDIAKHLEGSDIDKVKTVGRYCLLAVGLPTGNNGNMEILARWAKNVFPKLNGTMYHGFKVDVNVVLHHGDFFAGVIGKKKLRFDVWGPQIEKLQRAMWDVWELQQHTGIYATPDAFDTLTRKFIFSVSIKNTSGGKLYKLDKESAHD